MPTTDSLPLLTLVQGGDVRAMNDLLARHLPGLRAYVRLQCGPSLRAKESASDIVQSACRDVLEHLDEFRWNGEAGFKAWLYVSALRKIADRANHWSAQKRDAGRNVPLEQPVGGMSGDSPLADIYSDVATPSQVAQGREQLERLESAFDALNEGQREIIVLARVVGLSHEEIASKLGCSAATARQRLLRALGALSARLESPDGAQGSRN